MDNHFADGPEFFDDSNGPADQTYRFTSQPPSASASSRRPGSLFSSLSPQTQGTSAVLTPSPSDYGFANPADWDEWRDWIDLDGAPDGDLPQSLMFPQLDAQFPTSFPFNFPNAPTTQGLSEPPLFPALSKQDPSGLPRVSEGNPVPLREIGLGGIAQLQSIPEAPSFAEQVTPPSSQGQRSPWELDQAGPSISDAPLSAKKRKLDLLDDDDDDEGSSPEDSNTRRGTAQRNTSHNTVEKRYRNRLKDMIARLRDHVPALKQMDSGADRGMSSQVTKGLVLSKAADYIVELETGNRKLTDENNMLRKQILALGKLNGQLTAQTASPRRANGGTMSKVMVGGMAGMLAMQGFHTPEQSNEMPSGRGLFALPTNLVPDMMRALRSHHLSVLADSAHIDAGFALLRGVLILSAVVYIFLPWVSRALTPKPEPTKTTEASVTPSDARRSVLASMQEVRSAAFHTATRSVWFPSRGLRLFVAVALQAAKLFLHKRNMFVTVPGGNGHTVQEAASGARAWDEAVDAQLAGGDDHATFGRMLLTYAAASSLPETPYRLMLLAMHARILAHLAVDWWARPLRGPLLAACQKSWKHARTLREASKKAPTTEQDQALPSHLSKLLELDADDVFVDELVGRMSDNARGTASGENASSGENWHDTIPQDTTLVSPLDLLAAWRSATILRDALATYPGADSADEVEDELTLALRLTPPSSSVWARSLVVQALAVSGEGQRQRIAAAFQAVLAASSRSFISVDVAAGPSLVTRSPTKDLTNSNPIPRDLAMALRCAIAIDRLGDPEEDRAMWALGKEIDGLPQAKDEPLEALEAVALYRLLRVLYDDRELAGKHRDMCEKVSGLLRVSIRKSGESGALGLDEASETKVASLCVDVLEWLVGIKVVEDGAVGG